MQQHTQSVAQRVVAAIFLLLSASPLPSPPPYVLCSPTCGTSDGSWSIDGRKFERFEKWPLRFVLFFFPQPKDLREAIVDNRKNGSSFFKTIVNRRNDDTQITTILFFVLYIWTVWKLKFFFYVDVIIFKEDEIKKRSVTNFGFINFVKIDLFYI